MPLGGLFRSTALFDVYMYVLIPLPAAAFTSGAGRPSALVCIPSGPLFLMACRGHRTFVNNHLAPSP